MSTTPPTHGHPFMDCLEDCPRMSGLFDLITILGSDKCFFVGGAVRDHLLGHPADSVRDIDILYDGDLSQFADVFSERYEVSRTPFGNPSLILDAGLRVDLFPPATPYGEPLPVTDALHCCDSSANAIALRADDGTLQDPTGGLRDLVARRTRLLPGGWSADASTRARLLAKTADLHQRRRLTPVDLHIADEAADQLRTLGHDEVLPYLRIYTQWRASI